MAAVTAEKILVVHTRDMSHEDFARHMNTRHSDSLGDLNYLDWEYMGLDLGHHIDVVMAWRAFHRRLHELRLDYDHEHA